MPSDLKNIVILGANGFVGSHLVDQIAVLPDTKVICFDRFNSPQAFKNAPNIEVVKGDLLIDEETNRVLEDADYVIHCFSATTPQTSDNDPYTDITMLKRNVEIFEKCAKYDVKKIIFISSGGAVYGSISEQAVASELDVAMPVSPYGICKLATEHYLEYFKRKYDIPYIVYRLTNPYGPRQSQTNKHGVIPIFLDKIKNSQVLTVLGDGNNSRDFIFIEDAAKMITKSFMQNNKYPVYNIGSGVQTTINEIIATLKELVDHEITVEYQEAPKTFLKKTSVSIERFNTEFGKPVFTELKSGLLKTIK